MYFTDRAYDAASECCSSSTFHVVYCHLLREVVKKVVQRSAAIKDILYLVVVPDTLISVLEGPLQLVILPGFFAMLAINTICNYTALGLCEVCMYLVVVPDTLINVLEEPLQLFFAMLARWVAKFCTPIRERVIHECSPQMFHSLN